MACSDAPGAGSEGMSTTGTTVSDTGNLASSTSTGTPTPTSSAGSSTAGSTGETTAETTAETTGDTSGETTEVTTSSTSTGEPVDETWLRSCGAPESQHPGGLGFAAGGELWVAGDVYGSINLGAGLLAPAGSGIYLAKYAPDGAAIHTLSFAPAGGEPTLTQVSGLVVDGAGAVIVTGWLEGSYTLGGSELSANEVDFYVAKWDAAGEPVWGQKFGGVDWQVSAALALGPDDSVWVAGAALAPFDMGDIVLTGAASTGMFVARLAADGTPLQGQWWGETGNQEIRSIAVCGDDSLAIGGFFDDSLQFGAQKVQSVGDKDMFVAHLDPAGAPTWIRAHGSSSVDYVQQVACDATLAFAGVGTGKLQVGELELDPAGDADVALARLDLDGNLIMAVAITGPGDQLPTGLALLPGGDSVMAFTSAGTATLGDLQYVAAGASDLVFARHTPSAATPVQLLGVGDGAVQRSGPLAVHATGVAALAGSFAGKISWPGLSPVVAEGPEDLVLVHFTPEP